ncbi:MAG: quinone oxidoreductase family protein [Actinomycetota bacterium]
MRAAVVEKIAQPPRPGEVAEPERGRGESLVEVRAASLNPIDLAIASGRFYAGPPQVPYVPGTEGSGVILEGETLPPGTRVRFEVQAGYGRNGALAERVGVADRDLIPLPETADDALAAALGIAGLAAWLALVHRAGLRAGETVLVLGASGALGQLAVQGAKLLGAGRVVAAARSRHGLERAASLGADAIVVLGDESREELAKRFRQAAGGEIDVVVDPLWGEPAMAALGALGLEGRLVNLGQSAAASANLTSAAVRGRMRAILGHSNLTTPPEVKADTYRTLLTHAMNGELTVDLEEVSLVEVTAAWERQAGFPSRKIVVRPGMWIRPPGQGT